MIADVKDGYLRTSLAHNQLVPTSLKTAIASLKTEHLRRCLQQKFWAGLLQVWQLGIGVVHVLSMVPVLERTRLSTPVQVFQPFSHFVPARFPNTTMFTIWAVDSQEGQ